jgi:hypothetical protein
VRTHALTPKSGYLHGDSQRPVVEAMLFILKLWYTKRPGCFDRLKFHEIVQAHMNSSQRCKIPRESFLLPAMRDDKFDQQSFVSHSMGVNYV